MTNIQNSEGRGFIALIALILLASGTIAFSLVTMSAAVSYADSVNQREYRIQARLNAQSCVEVVSLMLAKDFYLNGEVDVPEFGCIAEVSNPNAVSPVDSWTVTIEAETDLNGVRARESGSIDMSDFSVI